MFKWLVLHPHVPEYGGYLEEDFYTLANTYKFYWEFYENDSSEDMRREFLEFCEWLKSIPLGEVCIIPGTDEKIVKVYIPQVADSFAFKE